MNFLKNFFLFACAKSVNFGKALPYFFLSQSYGLQIDKRMIYSSGITVCQNLIYIALTV